jgi:hypothetical protein
MPPLSGLSARSASKALLFDNAARELRGENRARRRRVMDAEETPGDDESSSKMTELSRRVRIDVEFICDLFDKGVEVDGDAVLAEGPKWIIYGRTTYDGELILAEYEDPAEAEAVLRSLPEHVTGRRSR